MSRERWFYAKDMRRVGPLPERRLVQSLLAFPEPRGCLIWRHGLSAWTPARDVPEIDRQLVPFIKKAEPAPAPKPAAPAAPHAPAWSDTVAERTREVADRALPRPMRERPRPEPPSIALYFTGLAVLLVVVIAGWYFWPHQDEGLGPQPTRSASATRPGAAASPELGAARRGSLPASPGTGRPSTERSSEPAPASPAAGGAPSNGTAAGAPRFAGWSDVESDVPVSELRRLRGVGGWIGERLTITLYNGSTWRITEILVRTSRLRGDDFVDAETPQRLLPAGGPVFDSGTAELLRKVAPDRKKPGVNPLDTGPFEAVVGPQPGAYRWRIEAARGYPPRQ